MQIGNDFKVSYESDTIISVLDVGGYKVITDTDKGVLIQGIKLINTFELNIDYTSIIPLTNDSLLQMEHFPFDFVNDTTIVYQVSNSGLAWYFLDKSDAHLMLDVFLQVKVYALEAASNINAKKDLQ